MRAPTGTLLRLALVVSAALVVVSGCSDEPDKPGTLPSPNATSSSASPTPDTPEEQVEAAVRAYYAELTRAAQTQDTAAFKRLVTMGCPCYGAAQAIDKTRRRGLSTPAVAWIVDSIRVHEIEGKTALAEVKYSVAAYKVLDGQGNVVDSYPTQEGHVDLSLVLSERGWVVGNLFDLEG